MREENTIKTQQLNTGNVNCQAKVKNSKNIKIKIKNYKKKLQKNNAKINEP